VFYLKVLRTFFVFERRTERAMLIGRDHSVWTITFFKPFDAPEFD